jgi:hypothetical protein
MNHSITETIEQRFSCRSYDLTPIDPERRRVLKDFLSANCIGPFGTHVRLELAAASEQDRRSLKGLGTYGYIKNPPGFIIGAIGQGEKNLEDYGYLLEHAILFATNIGLGTCWLGGTFTKSGFAKKISLLENESIPAVVSVGSIAEKTQRGDLVRKFAGSNRRLPPEQLFFDQNFGTPLRISETDPSALLLKTVRWAPSASNKQPWRIVHSGDAWHFYLQRTKGYGKGTMLFSFLRLADLQRVDMGIAMCHFELTARELGLPAEARRAQAGLPGRWIVNDPKIQKPENTEYTASWTASNG